MIKRNTPHASSSKWFTVSILLLITLFCCAIALLCLVPPVSRDALVHHLAIPKLYLEAGRMIELPCMVYSYYPMNLDLLYIAALYLGSDIASKFIHFAFGLMTAGLIYHYLKRRTNLYYALTGVILFLSIPVIVKLSTTVYVDLGLVFFSTASLLAVLKWVETEFKLKYLLIAGAACGLAMGTKYNGLITLFLLSLFVPFLYSRCKKKTSNPGLKPVGWALVFVVSALILFSPWMIRNYTWTKNPVYPLYNSVFSTKIDTPCVTSRFPVITNAPPVDMFTLREYLYDETWWEMALLPLRIFFQGADNDFKHFDGKLSPLLLFFSIFAFVSFNKKTDRSDEIDKIAETDGRDELDKKGDIKTEPYIYEKKVFILFAFLFFLISFFSAVLRIRYFLPSIPPLVILSIYGLKNVVDYARLSSRSTMKKGIAWSIILLSGLYMTVSTTGYIAEQFHRGRPLQYLSGEITKDEYIASFRNEYPAFQFINEHLPADATILFFYVGKRGYYCNRNYIPYAGNTVKMFHQLITSIKTPQEVPSFFKEIGISHFLINNSLFTTSMENNISEDESEAIGMFMYTHTNKLFDRNGYSLFELLK